MNDKQEEKKQIYYKKIDFPHLRASFQFLDLSKLKGVPIVGSGYTTIMSKDEFESIEIGIFLEEIEKNIKKIECMPYIFHEIIHALQYLCEERGMDMGEEKEGVAYIGTYLLQELLT